MKMSSVLIKFLEIFSPPLLLKLRANYGSGRESELELIPYLCDKDKISVDIGANRGVYAYHMKKHSKKCWAFEPNPELSRILMQSLGTNVVIESIALSDKNETVQLRIPTISDYSGTIEEENTLKGFKQITTVNVQVKKLDEYDFESVGFIKVDVEGHEENVLRGARNLLLRDRPSLLIEAEERHKPKAVKNIIKFLSELGYQGFFYTEGYLEKIEELKEEKYQNFSSLQNSEKIRKMIKKDLYVNNFIFLVPANIDKVSKFLKIGNKQK